MVQRFSWFCLAVALFVSCSSAPKRPAEIFNIQAITETQLGLANKEADQGNYADALLFLDEARRLAVLTDRPALRIRVNLSRGSVLFSMNRALEAEQVWKAAELEAELAGETALASAARVYIARSGIISGQGDIGQWYNIVLSEQNNLKSDKLLSAAGWTVRGLAEKELALYGEAEKSIRNALSIHEGGRYLEQAAYDWYLIASVRSVAGNYEPALDALHRALDFDRRSENSFGLGKDWSAMGEVYRKMGEEALASMAWRRAAEIFRAMDRTAEAKEAESRIRE